MLPAIVARIVTINNTCPHPALCCQHTGCQLSRHPTTCLRAMELITILNRCHRHPGFVYQHARFSLGKKSIRGLSAAAQAFGRSLLALPFAGAGYEFILLWGFLVFLLYTMRRVDCRRCGVVAVEEVPWGDGKRTLTRAYMLFLARWARRLSWKETAEGLRTS